MSRIIHWFCNHKCLEIVMIWAWWLLTGSRGCKPYLRVFWQSDSGDTSEYTWACFWVALKSSKIQNTWQKRNLETLKTTLWYDVHLKTTKHIWNVTKFRGLTFFCFSKSMKMYRYVIYFSVNIIHPLNKCRLFWQFEPGNILWYCPPPILENIPTR